MTKNRILNISLFFGLTAGLLCFIYFLIMYFSLDDPLANRRPDLGLNIIMIGAAIWYFRRKNNGYIHFYQGFSVGFLTNLIAALLSGILIFLFLQFVDYKPFETWLANSKQMLIEDRPRSQELMDEKTYQALLKSFDNKSAALIILDELVFKQLAVIAVTLFSMGFRKIKQN